MKRTQVSMEEAKGKALEHTIFAGRYQVAILWADNTFSVLGTAEEDAHIYEDDFDEYMFTAKEQVLLGVTTQEEVDDIIKERELASARRSEKNDLKEFERLKAKFG
jgi:hypothetical protein